MCLVEVGTPNPRSGRYKLSQPLTFEAWLEPQTFCVLSHSPSTNKFLCKMDPEALKPEAHILFAETFSSGSERTKPLHATNKFRLSSKGNLAFVKRKARVAVFLYVADIAHLLR